MSAADKKPKSQLEALRERQAKESPIDQGPNPEARIENIRRNTAHLVLRDRREGSWSQLEALRERQANETPLDTPPNREALLEQWKRNTEHQVRQN